ncbi:MAG: SAM-dependent methyltransferase [Acidobacteriia bacterium]|nr:SAM-dependent methyltransferase [Terriglobia bacterium]
MNAIVAEVARRGRLSFAEFMELALYHPSAGYYTRRRSGPGPAGRAGDFLTAPTTSPIFSRTLAEILAQLAAALGEPIIMVELGAGEGILLEGVLVQLGDRRGDVLRRVVAVEAAEWARSRIVRRCRGVETEARLSDARWPDGPVVLFASEYYDALAVHRITARADSGGVALAEYYVEHDGGTGLRWTLGEPSTPKILEYLAEHGVALVDGQVAEIRPQARSVHAGHLRWCGLDAVALVLDYGYPGRRLYDARARRGGSLVGYRAHALVDNVLGDPGEVDITAHVNFDDLENAAADANWERGIIRALGSFLTVHNALSLLPGAVARGEPLTPEEWAQLAAAKRLLLPTGMGADLKVLAQGRGRAWQAYLQLATAPPAEA